MVIGIASAFFPLGLDNLCSRTNSINILIHGKMAEDCAKVIRHGVKYIYIFLFQELFSTDVF